MPSTGKAESAKNKKMLGQQVRTAIEALHAENEELKKDLARETRQANLTATMGKGQGSQAARLQEEADLYLKKIENERNKIAVLDAKISQCKKEMTAQRQKMGGVNAGKENHDMLVKQIKLMEKKLDKALQKFNEALAQNKTLRGYIDSLHKERVVFDGIYKKLEYDLHKKKKEMAAIIEDSKNAQRRADRSQRSLDKLKQGMEDEKKAFEKEWADLGALMEQDRQLQEALRRKEREEHERKTAEALAASQRADEEPYMSEDPEESEEEEEESPGKKKKVEEDRPKLTEEEVQEYQATFERITKATGIQTVEELVDTFQDIEQKNFSLFNSINELNSDIEATELAIAETKLETEKFKGQGVSTDTQRKRVLKELEEKLEKTTAAADAYERKHQAASKTIGQLKTGIHSIFSRLGGTSAAVEEMLGNQGVTESNMLQYLEIIEQRTTEILEQYAATQPDCTPHPPGTSAIGVVMPPANRIVVAPPAYDDMDEDDEEEDDERPLTRGEIVRKTLRGLESKEKRLAETREKQLTKL